MLKTLASKILALSFLLPGLSSCAVTEQKLKVSLSDWPGYEYIWLAKENGYLERFELIEDPDTSLALEQREPGGLGLFLIKKLSRSVHYSYDNG